LTDVLQIEVKADQAIRETNKLSKALDKLEKEGDGVAKSFKKVDSSTKKLSGDFAKLKGIITGAAIAALAKQLINFGKSALDAADKVQKLASTTGLGVEAFQELSHAMSVGGVSSSQFEQNMIAFVKRVGEARVGMGPLNTGLKNLNSELLESIKNSTSQEQAFDLLANAMEEAGSATERAALANAAFGRSGVQMTTAMKDGSVAIKGLRGQIVTLSQVNADAAAEMNDSWNLFWKNFKTGAQNMAIDFIHSLNVMGRASSDFTGVELAKEISAVQNSITSNLEKLDPSKWYSSLVNEKEIRARIAIGRAQLEDLKILQSENKEFEFQTEGIFKIGDNAASATKDVENLKTALTGGGGGGGGGISKTKNVIGDLENDFIQLYESLNPIVKLNREYAEDTNLLNSALINQLATTDQIVIAQAKLDEEYLRAKEDITELSEATNEWGEIADSAITNFASGIADTLVDGIMEGEIAFDQFAQSFLANIAKMIIETQVLAAMKLIFGGGIASAKGNVIQTGEVLPFAKGGIVSSPTVFPMANGIGLMGEAGPEAIMPLKRNSKGELGVVNSNNSGDVTVNQTFEFNGSGGGDQIMQLRAEGNRIKVETLAAVENSIRRGGSMARAVGRKQ
jgi:hypothetical protein